MRRLLLIAALVSGGLAPTPDRSLAQTVRGRVLETDSRRPVVLANVGLVDTTGAAVDASVTDEEGRFLLEAPGPGAYYLSVSRIGYRDLTDGVLDLGEGGSITIDFFLRPRPVELDSLVARVEREEIRESLESQGFYRRMKHGIGDFITPEEIEARAWFDTGELLRKAPFVLTGEGVFGTTVRMKSRMGSRFCSPKILVDGAPIPRGFAIDDYVGVADILAVEVYRGLRTPPRWSSGGGTCGTILIWTNWSQPIRR